MAAGRTVILLNHDNIYEALYDVLNQRYVMRKDPQSGQVRRLLRLGNFFHKPEPLIFTLNLIRGSANFISHWHAESIV
jgi:hypothetical protein